MCGIAGILSFETDTATDASVRSVRNMVELMKHRGPDDEGFYQDDRMVLGHCRLSIIDLSSAGRQPMCNENRSLWLTYNGEIYNHRELRNELEREGHSFKSHTDSEVILHAYEQWGESCLSRFNGMWAFGLWDSVNRRLFCSRDRFGIKPFYYVLEKQRFIFASEIKAILSAVDRKPDLNDSTCYRFLSRGRTELGSGTFYRGIERLMPAHWMRLGVPGPCDQQSGSYWDVQCRAGYASKPEKEESANRTEAFYSLFEDSVNLRLQSDVPVGSCLSGGLDSSSIVCAVSRILGRMPSDYRSIGDRLKTFSACFSYPWCDERAFSVPVAEYCQAESHQIFPSGDRILESLSTMLRFHDEPFPSTNVFSQWNVMQLASSRGIKVLLDGQGGDELLGGYLPYVSHFLLDLLRNKRYARCLGELFSLFPSGLSLLFGSVFHAVRQGFASDRTAASSFLSFDPQPWRDIPARRKFRSVREMLKEHLTESSVPDLLRYEDRNAMAHSIESRLPFLDYRLVEQVFSLPVDDLYRFGWTKRILRQAMKGKMPDRVRQRRSKLGFATPESIWLNENRNAVKKLFVRSENELGDRFLNRKHILKHLNSLLGIRQSPSISPLTRWIIFDLWLLKQAGNKPSIATRRNQAITVETPEGEKVFE